MAICAENPACSVVPSASEMRALCKRAVTAMAPKDNSAVIDLAYSWKEKEKDLICGKNMEICWILNGENIQKNKL